MPLSIAVACDGGASHWKLVLGCNTDGRLSLWIMSSTGVATGVLLLFQCFGVSDDLLNAGNLLGESPVNKISTEKLHVNKYMN